MAGWSDEDLAVARRFLVEMTAVIERHARAADEPATRPRPARAQR
jgi:hypothetical protein